MSVTDNRRPVLVADRRYVAAQKAASGSGGGTRKPPAAKTKSAPRRRPPKRNPVTGFFGGILRWIMRVIWGIGWRVAFLLAIVIGSVTLFFYQKLPDVTALLDARARGSVTLLDRNGQVFAWRGETFGGQIDAASVSPNLLNAIVATEDRKIFAEKLREIHEKIAEGLTAETPEDVVACARKLGYPVILRAAFALGGLGSGFASNDEECLALATQALSGSPQVLV